MIASGIFLLCAIAFIVVCIVRRLVERRKNSQREREEQFWQREQRRKRAIKVRRIRALQKAGVDGMSQTQFQKFVRDLLQRQGHSITLATTDMFFAERNGTIFTVIVKLHAAPVARCAIIKALPEQENCDGRFVFVTNGIFTSGAERLAGLILVDRNLLAEWIVNSQRNKDEESRFVYVDESIAWVSVGDEFFQD